MKKKIILFFFTEDDYVKDDPDLYKPVNIGFPLNNGILNGKGKRKRRFLSMNPHLEKSARNRTRKYFHIILVAKRFFVVFI